MTHGTLSPEGTLQAMLSRFGCSTASFCEIVGFSRATMSRILAGERSFNTDELDTVERSLDAMRTLQHETNNEYRKQVQIEWGRKDMPEIIKLRCLCQMNYEDTGDPKWKQYAKDIGVVRLPKDLR